MPDDSPLVIPLPDDLDPRAATHHLRGLPFLALLEGAVDHEDLGRWSYLAADPIERIVPHANDWPRIRSRLRETLRDAPHCAGLPPFFGGWIGWLGYELGAAFDRQPTSPRDHFSAHDGELQLHDWVIAWDHVAHRAWLISTGLESDGRRSAQRAAERAEPILALLTATPAGEPPSREVEAHEIVHRTFGAEEYQRAVRDVVELIRAGDIFQANLSQRFVVPTTADAHTIYHRLRQRAPASHAALLAFGERSVLSASPESFLRYDQTTRRIESRPIKGTRPRGTDAASDERLADELQSSMKDRAENLMIVDLVRNDLHRVADAASVDVPVLCRLDSHATVHHLVSIVTARLREECDAIDLLEAAFPAGSITGAPKLQAMAILAEREPVARGVYCGAIGWLGLDGSLGLSVAIRTMMVHHGQAAVHAGGGITLLSNPTEEFDETLDKARALLQSLGATP